VPELVTFRHYPAVHATPLRDTLRRMKPAISTKGVLTVIAIMLIVVSAAAQTQTFLAGQMSVPKGLSGLFVPIDNNTFTCTVVKPLSDGDVLASMGARGQSWSIETNAAGDPIFAMLKGTDGQDRALLPAVLKLKIDIKAGAVLHISTEGKLSFDVETKRAIKAGDSISVLYINGPSIISFEADDRTGTSSEAQPWFTAFVDDEKPASRRGDVDAWRTERNYVHR
jgi:hypothetical protein